MMVTVVGTRANVGNEMIFEMLAAIYCLRISIHDSLAVNIKNYWRL